MSDEPGGADLLQVARETLIGEVLPGLAGNQRFATLMVASALGMVERELTVNGRLGAADRALRAFADQDGPEEPTAARALCRAIRSGRHDGDPRLHRALYRRATEAVAITRPDYLTVEEQDQVAHQATTWEAMNESDKGSRDGPAGLRLR